MATEGSKAFGIMSEGMGLTPKQRQLIIRVLWVIAVTAYMAWTIGVLSVIGLSSPFAKAHDVQTQLQQHGQQLSDLKQTLESTARVTLGQEIRAQAGLRCKVTDPSVRDALTRYIEALQSEYGRVSGGMRYPEPPC